MLLIHGVGSRWQIWEPAIDRLAAERDVISVDLPGHGSSPMPRNGFSFAPKSLAHLIARFMDTLGLDRAHLAGNSLGGWISLELAKMGRACSVTALSPAGLWRGSPPAYIGAVFFGTYAASVGLGPFASFAASDSILRSFLMGPFFGRPWKLPASEALATLSGFTRSPALYRIMEDTRNERFVGGSEIDVPVTVAWGAREAVLLPWQSRNREELPSHARWLTLPGCGHVPTYDDPDLVTKVLLEGSASSEPGDTRARSAPEVHR